MIELSSEALSDIDRIREFLEANYAPAAPRALRAIWAALRRVEQSPQIGQATEHERVRQIFVRFGRRGYVVRYTVLADETIFVTRVWHGREERR